MTKRREYEATKNGLFRGFVAVCIAIVIAVILMILAGMGWATSAEAKRLRLTITAPPHPHITPYYNVFPIPPRYDHQPRVPMTLYEMSPFEIIFHCGLAYACTHMYGTRCVFYMPTGRSAYFWKHESAHCLGWPPNHPYP